MGKAKILLGYSLIFHATEKNDMQEMDIGIPYSTTEIVICVDLLNTKPDWFSSFPFFFFLTEESIVSGANLNPKTKMYKHETKKSNWFSQIGILL